MGHTTILWAELEMASRAWVERLPSNSGLEVTRLEMMIGYLGGRTWRSHIGPGLDGEFQECSRLNYENFSFLSASANQNSNARLDFIDEFYFLKFVLP